MASPGLPSSFFGSALTFSTTASTYIYFLESSSALASALISAHDFFFSCYLIASTLVSFLAKVAFLAALKFDIMLLN
jgi:hypothetical protein